jgi:hypothetical protein
MYRTVYLLVYSESLLVEELSAEETNVYVVIKQQQQYQGDIGLTIDRTYCT